MHLPDDRAQMQVAYLVTIMLGFAAVLQAGLNRKIAVLWGMPGTAVLNSLIFIFFSLAVFLLTKIYQGNVSGILADRGSFKSFSWWFLIPGILGFALVFCVPIVIERIGAVALFVGLISSQLVASFLWDYYMESIPITAVRVCGAVLAAAGAIVVNWKGAPN